MIKNQYFMFSDEAFASIYLFIHTNTWEQDAQIYDGKFD